MSDGGRQFIFEGMDPQGEAVEGQIRGATEHDVAERLRRDLGYVVNSVREQHPPQPEVAVNRSEQLLLQKPPVVSESIIFQQPPTVVRPKPVIAEDEFTEFIQKIQYLLSEKTTYLSSITQDHLRHLLEMIELARETQNKKRWKNLKRQIQNHLGFADREIAEKEDEKWKALEEKLPGKKVESYSDILDRKVRKIILPEGWFGRFFQWLKKINLPNEEREDEVLLKQQYESVWIELQRFTAALLAFYLLFLFAAYVLEHTGVEDHVLLRIYDTTLFKQLMMVLFSLFMVLTIRVSYLRARIMSDAVVALLWIGVLGWVFW